MRHFKKISSKGRNGEDFTLSLEIVAKNSRLSDESERI